MTLLWAHHSISEVWPPSGGSSFQPLDSRRQAAEMNFLQKGIKSGKFWPSSDLGKNLLGYPLRERLWAVLYFHFMFEKYFFFSFSALSFLVLSYHTLVCLRAPNRQNSCFYEHDCTSWRSVNNIAYDEPHSAGTFSPKYNASCKGILRFHTEPFHLDTQLWKKMLTLWNVVLRTRGVKKYSYANIAWYSVDIQKQCIRLQFKKF